MSIANDDVQSLIFKQSTFRDCIIHKKYNEATLIRADNPITISFNRQLTGYSDTTPSIFKINFNKMWIVEHGKCKYTFLDLNAVRSLCFQLIANCMQSFSCKSFIINFNENPLLQWHFPDLSAENTALRSNIHDLFEIYIGLIEMKE